MLCRGCRRLVSSDQLYCGVCGRPVARGIVPPLDIVLRDGSRVALVGRLTVGRAPDNGLQLDDRSVSRHHCVIAVDDYEPSSRMRARATAHFWTGTG